MLLFLSSAASNARVSLLAHFSHNNVQGCSSVSTALVRSLASLHNTASWSGTNQGAPPTAAQDRIATTRAGATAAAACEPWLGSEQLAHAHNSSSSSGGSTSSCLSLRQCTGTTNASGVVCPQQLPNNSWRSVEWSQPCHHSDAPQQQQQHGVQQQQQLSTPGSNTAHPTTAWQLQQHPVLPLLQHRPWWQHQQQLHQLHHQQQQQSSKRCMSTDGRLDSAENETVSQFVSNSSTSSSSSGGGKLRRSLPSWAPLRPPQLLQYHQQQLQRQQQQQQPQQQEHMMPQQQRRLEQEQQRLLRLQKHQQLTPQQQRELQLLQRHLERKQQQQQHTPSSAATATTTTSSSTSPLQEIQVVRVVSDQMRQAAAAAADPAAGAAASSAFAAAAAEPPVTLSARVQPQQTAATTTFQYPVHAVHVGAEIDAQLFADEHKNAFDEVVQQIGHKDHIIFKLAACDEHQDLLATKSSTELEAELRYMVVYRYGSVIFVNVPRSVVEAHLALLKPYLKPPQGQGVPVLDMQSMRSDETTIVVDGGLSSWSKLGPDKVIVQKLDVANLRVISNVLSQSVALDYFNSRVDEAIKRFTPYLVSVATSGQCDSVKEAGLLQLIAENSLMYTDVVTKIGLLDISQTAWKQDRHYELWESLRADYEIEMRFEAIDRKLGPMIENAKFLLDVRAEQKSSGAEWIIIGLIMLEVLINLVGHAATWKA